jgi:hypothetical protein
MNRPQTYPLALALIEVLETIEDVGWGENPDAPYPYFVVTEFSGPEGEGPIDDFQADVEDTFQVSAIGVTAQQVSRMLDMARGALTRSSLQSSLDSITASETEYEDRHIMWVKVTIAGQGFREERGLPEPVFQNGDRVTIKHTPK